MTYFAESGSGNLRGLSRGDNDRATMNPLGYTVSHDSMLHLALEGRVFTTGGGAGTTPITFAGAYDANGPDFHLNVPNGTTVIPLYLSVNFDAVGTESTMEIIGLASDTGDSSVTGTASTVYNFRTDNPRSTNCTATVAVDAGGVTDPNANNFFEFWRESRPLTDTVATGENDRHGLTFEWSAGRDGPPPIISGTGTRDAALVLYAASQAGTGFIVATWAELPSANLGI